MKTIALELFLIVLVILTACIDKVPTLNEKVTQGVLKAPITLYTKNYVNPAVKDINGNTHILSKEEQVGYMIAFKNVGDTIIQ